MSMDERTSAGATLEPTLPGSYYVDPAILEKEWDRIFFRSWLYAGREEGVAEPGAYRTLQVGPESVLIVRDRGGALRAFYNVCRHRGSILCEAETGSLRSIRCPYHAWTYGLDGRLLAAPNLRDAALPDGELALRTIALETWRGGVFVNLDPASTPLRESLGDLPDRMQRYPLERLRVQTHAVYEVQANWKILVENYQECYHCPGVHPELCDLVPLYRTGVVDEVGTDRIALFRKGASTLTASGTSARPLFADLTERERRTFDGALLLPNSWMNFLPDFVQTRTLWPISPGRTRIVTDWLFEPETMARADFDATDVLSFTQLIAEQDWKVCEAVQKGVGSRGFGRGIYTPLEANPGRFARWVTDLLDAPMA